MDEYENLTTMLLNGKDTNILAYDEIEIELLNYDFRRQDRKVEKERNVTETLFVH